MSVDALRHWVFNYSMAAVTAGLWFVVCRRRPFGRKHERYGLLIIAALPIAFEPSIIPEWLTRISQGGSFLLTLGLLCAALYYFFRVQPPFDSSRRRALAVAAPALAAVPAVLGGAAIVVARANPRLDVVDVPIAGLPRDLDGFRIVQLSDLHYGAYFGRRDAERAIALANETRAHLAVLTGDLVTYRSDDLEGLVGMLARLKCDAGIYGCHGNHEVNAGVVELADDLTARRGIRILRQTAETLRFGGARLRLAGVDYHPLRRPLPAATKSLQEDGAFNLLLCHNPGSFPSVREMGFDLMLSGHTHGGQINLEIARANLNIALVYTPYVRGLYTENGRSIYVSSGLGTVGAPIRLGAPPEVSLIRLCAA